MDVRRLQLLVDLERLGSMRAVAEETGVTTSTVSQQLAALARDSGAALVEPVGRKVRLTPAGHRLAAHAVGILAAVEAARLDLDPTAEPAGAVEVAGFATAIRRALLPVVEEVCESHPGVRVLINEFEPIEALDLLSRDDVDLALVYDYNLAPISFAPDVRAVRLWDVGWGLGVPAGDLAPGAPRGPADLAAYAGTPWIVNSRNTADEEVVRTLASLAGFAPRVSHRIDSLELVADLITAGRGVGLLPLGAHHDGVSVLRLPGPGALLRAYAVVRRGRAGWPPLRLILDRVVATGR